MNKALDTVSNTSVPFSIDFVRFPGTNHPLRSLSIPDSGEHFSSKPVAKAVLRSHLVLAAHRPFPLKMGAMSIGTFAFCMMMMHE
jgi:hypothetical protein